MSRLLDTISYMATNGVKTDKVPEEVKEQRLEVCRACERFVKPTVQCGVCWCFLNVKAALVFDPVESVKQARNVRVKCPLNKWGEYQKVKTNQK